MCPFYGELHRNVTLTLMKALKEERQQMTEERKDTTMKIELKDTVDMMLSPDHKERFKAEYWQLKNRLEGLHTTNVKREADTLKFKPNSTKGILERQEAVMREYLTILEIRSEMEDIPLGGEK